MLYSASCGIRDSESRMKVVAAYFPGVIAVSVNAVLYDPDSITMLRCGLWLAVSTLCVACSDCQVVHFGLFSRAVFSFEYLWVS